MNGRLTALDPREGVAHRLLDRPSLEPRVEGGRGIDGEHPRVLRAREPERELQPLADVVLEQEARLDPDELGVGAGDATTGIEQRLARHGAGHGVVRPGEPVLRCLDDPRCQVAGVDHLRVRVRRRRRQHAAAGGQALRPVREAAGRVPPADDQSGPRHEGLGEPLPHDVLAVRLQLAVRLAPFLGRRRQLTHAGALRRRRREVGVDRDRRDEGVVADIAERIDRLPDDARHVAARVDDGVERAAGERGEVAVAVAVQLLDVREELGPRAAAVERGHGVPARERDLARVAAAELRAAEDEDAHPATLRQVQSLSWRGSRSCIARSEAGMTDAPRVSRRSSTGWGTKRR